MFSLSAKNSRCYTALCKYRSLPGIDDCIKPAWQKKPNQKLLNCGNSLPRSGVVHSKTALAGSTVARHGAMAHFLSVHCRRHPLLRLGASCGFSTSPKQKPDCNPASRFKKGRRNIHTLNLVHLGLHLSCLHPFTGQMKTDRSGNAATYFRIEAGEHPSPGAYRRPTREHRLELNN